MPNRHLMTALAAAAPGMTLSDPVLDTKGNVLLPAGTVLTAALLGSLVRHQIELLPIAAGGTSAAEEAAEREHRLARIDHLFRVAGTAGAARASSPPGTPGAAMDRTAGSPEPDAPSPKTDATDILRQYILHFRSETAS